MALWKYLPLPPGPDPHAEADARAAAAGNFRLIGARIRGKKHKHEGTHCDDWFEFATAGPWTFLAVSDGAGSKPLSRVGARASCQAALQQLQEDLQNHRLQQRSGANEWTNALKRHPENLAFESGDLEHAHIALQRAMVRGYQAVVTEFESRVNNPEYETFLGRKLELSDLSATLLLAVHLPVGLLGEDCSFVAACQIGDGMTGAIDSAGKLHLLGEADCGGFSGETEFLTSAKKLHAENLAYKTRTFFGKLRALMLMTDGVADDYFPNDPGLRHLWGDLLLNRIVPWHAPQNAEAANLGSDVEKLAYRSRVVWHNEHGQQEATLRSVAAFASGLGKPLDDVLACPALLWAAGEGEPLCPAAEPHERLRTWLDSYQVRGSFDDRTLVVMHREELP